METQRIKNSIIDGSFDLGGATRDVLLFVLETAYKEITPYLRCEQNIKNKNDEIIALKYKSDSTLGCLLTCIFILIGALVPVGLGWLADGEGWLHSRSVGISVGIGVLAFIIAILFIHRRTKRKAADEIRKCEEGLRDLKREKEDITGNFLLLLFIPSKYRNEHAISKMLEYVQNKEASTWEHCTSLYKTEEHPLKLTQQVAGEAATQ